MGAKMVRGNVSTLLMPSFGQASSSGQRGLDETQVSDPKV